MGGLFSTLRDEKSEEEPIEHLTLDDFMHRNKVNILLLYSYIGTGYHGLQYNFGEKTIETDLFQILCDSLLIPEDSFLSKASVKWDQVSRTDTGVHAAAQVLSCSVALPPNTKVKDIVSILNSNKRPDCPLYFIKCIMCPNRLKAQKFADGRRYLYLLPTSCFKSNEKSHFEYLRNEILPLFIGNHNYHNYTKRMRNDSQSAMRQIDEFTLSDTFEIDGEGFNIFTIRGKSFMMNQIRKMVATVIAASHGLLSSDEIKRTLSMEKWSLAKFPGTGLLLDKIEYNSFKKKSFGGGKVMNETNDPEFEASRPAVEKWKNEVLFPHIVQLHREDNMFNNWVNDVLIPFPPVHESDPRANRHDKKAQ